MQREEGELQAEQPTVQANAETAGHLKQEGHQEGEEGELQAEQPNGQANADTPEHLKQEAALREVREGQESYGDLD